MKHKLSVLLFLCALPTVNAWSQSTTGGAPATTADPNQLSQIMTWVLGVTAALLFIVAQIYMMRVNQMLARRVIQFEAGAHGVTLAADTPEETVSEAGENFWTRLRKKYWENAVPIEQEGEIMMHHNYDGIRELDNSLPPWWINMFYITIAFAGIYMYYYHWGGNGPSQKQEYEQQMEVAQKEKAIALSRMANAVDESNVTALTEPARLAEGELIYKANCLACHGQYGEGTVGPNFTDDYWIHGGGIKNMFKTIKYGVPEKGMIAWAAQLNPADMQKVASYILTLRGTNPPNPKAPQGQIWTEGATPTDTTATKPL